MASLIAVAGDREEALTALRFNRGAFDCRQLDHICEKRRFKALLESRLGVLVARRLGI
jgi:hypothetical protein